METLLFKQNHNTITHREILENSKYLDPRPIKSEYLVMGPRNWQLQKAPR